MDEYVFISDLHLDDHSPASLESFNQFLKTLRAGQHLYILGDLFNAWIGDTQTLAATTVISGLQEVADRGIAVSMMRGNRDFLLDQKFAEHCGARLLADPFHLDLNGKKIVLTHGDQLCTLDRAYQRFRKVIQSPFVHALNQALPVAFKRWIADLLRKKSHQAVKQKTMQMMDVHVPAVDAFFVEQQADWIIHGHTHRPAKHVHQIGEQKKERIVLGAWDVKPVICRVRQGEFSLEGL